MRAHSRERWALRAVGLGSALAVVALLIGSTQAGAQSRLLNASFELAELVPGSTQSQEQPIEVPRRAEVVSVASELGEGSDPAIGWGLELCPASGTCMAATPALVGRVLPAGTYLVRATAHAGNITMGGRSHIEGRIGLIDAGAAGALAQSATRRSGSWADRTLLALTGATGLSTLSALAAAMLGAGGVLWLVGRPVRSRDNDDAASEARR